MKKPDGIPHFLSYGNLMVYHWESLNRSPAYRSHHMLNARVKMKNIDET